jgi:hypothetical protein
MWRKMLIMLSYTRPSFWGAVAYDPQLCHSYTDTSVSLSRVSLVFWVHSFLGPTAPVVS